MDAELKAKWVKALRSGEYQQAKDHLRRGGGFCCLGVLCEISGTGAWQERGGFFDYIIGDWRASQYLPPILRSQYRISDDQCDPLMSMNDKGVPFEEIADYIEANL